MPMVGSYLMPRSMCSWIPNPKLPVSLKFSFLNSYSLTFRPRSRISSAFAPRTVQWTAIFSLRRIPNDRTVYRALENTGCWPVSCSNTCNTIQLVDLFRVNLYNVYISTYLGSSCQSVTRFTNANVQAQFANAQLAHGVLGLVLLNVLWIEKEKWTSMPIKPSKREAQSADRCRIHLTNTY